MLPVFWTHRGQSYQSQFVRERWTRDFSAFAGCCGYYRFFPCHGVRCLNSFSALSACGFNEIFFDSLSKDQLLAFASVT